MKHSDHSNISKDDEVQPVAEGEDKEKQWQRQRMGIDYEGIHNGCR